MTPAMAVHSEVMSGFVGAERLAEQGRINEAVEMFVKVSQSEQTFLWGRPYDDEQLDELRSAVRARYLREHGGAA